MFSKIKRQFFAGLVIFVPISITLYLCDLFFVLMSQTLLPIIVAQRLIEIPADYIRPVSFGITLLVIWLLGIIASNFLGKKLLSMFESTIHHIPVFRGFYEAIQKVTEAFFGPTSFYQSVVLVEYPRTGTFTFGFVTQRFAAAVFGATEEYLCVFIPTVPNPTSGMLLYVPSSATRPLDLSIEEAAKILVSHGFVPIKESSIQRKEPYVQS